MTLLDDAIHQAEHFVQNDKSGYLYLGLRNRLWDGLRAGFPDDWAERRAILGFLAARETMERWRRLSDVPPQFQTLAPDILAACRKTILRDISLKEAKRQYSLFDHLVGEFFGIYPPPEKLDDGEWPTHAPDAALSALDQALFPDLEWGDGRYEIVDEESSRRDPHFFACADAVGVDAGDDCVGDLSRGYWMHWLFDLFPKILATHELATSELREPPVR